MEIHELARQEVRLENSGGSGENSGQSDESFSNDALVGASGAVYFNYTMGEWQQGGSEAAGSAMNVLAIGVPYGIHAAACELSK